MRLRFHIKMVQPANALTIIFALLVTFQLRIAVIIRLPCKKFADFSVVYTNSTSDNFSLATKHHVTLHECKLSCIEDIHCQSISFKLHGITECRLHSSSPQSLVHDFPLKKRIGWVFVTTDHDNLLVGETCKALKPCGSNIRCVDSCECPGYKCHACRTNTIEPHCVSTWTSCNAVKRSGLLTRPGVFLIAPEYNPLTAFPVYCDSEDGVGWEVIQRRVQGNINFNRSWSQYKAGFGELNQDMWLGLDKVSRISYSGLRGILKVKLKTAGPAHATYFAEYDYFKVGNEDSNYKLSIGLYDRKSTAGDSFTPSSSYPIHNLDGQPFSTYDRDNDATAGNCAWDYGSGWWHRNCFLGNLNGQMYRGEPACHRWEVVPKYMSWYTINDCYGDISFSEMKMRSFYVAF